MDRKFSTEAIVLKSRAVGEQHRSLFLATSDRGNIWALAHGASSPKGRLHAHSSTFARSQMDISINVKTGGMRIAEAELLFLPDRMRGNLRAFWAAGLAAEIVASSEAGETEPEQYRLLSEALQILDALDAEAEPAPAKQGDTSPRLRDAASVLACYIWNCIRIHGILPNLASDSRSGAALADKAQVWYDLAHDGFVENPPDGWNLPALPGPGLRIISWLLGVPFSRACAQPLPAHTVPALCKIGTGILQRFHNRRFQSLARLDDVLLS